MAAVVSRLVWESQLPKLSFSPCLQLRGQTPENVENPLHFPQVTQRLSGGLRPAPCVAGRCKNNREKILRPILRRVDKMV